MNNSKKFPAVEKKSTKITSTVISKILDNGDLTPAEILDKMGLSQKSASSLSYYLGNMVKDEILKKIDGKYHKIPKPQSDVGEEVIKILLEDDCSLKNENTIKEKIKEDISEETLSWTLQILRNENQIFEHKKEFGISHDQLNKYDRCYICKKKFNDNQLIISAIMTDDDGMINNYQLHALCRNNLDKANKIFYNTSSANCDYCGLSLSAQMLFFNKIEEINLDKEIDTLFNEPFSKIFSSFDSTKYGDEGMNIRSFACNKTKDGKQYHPYCFDIIQKKESKK